MVRHHTPHTTNPEMEHEQINEREGKKIAQKKKNSNFEGIKVQLGSCCWGGFASTPRGMRAGFKLTLCQTVTKIISLWIVAEEY